MRNLVILILAAVLLTGCVPPSVMTGRDGDPGSAGAAADGGGGSSDKQVKLALTLMAVGAGGLYLMYRWAMSYKQAPAD
jgi:hypothetical protein